LSERERRDRLRAKPGRQGREVALSAGRVVLIVLGSIVALLGLALAAGGGFLLWTDLTQREGGYLTTPTERFATSTYALTRERLEVDTGGSDWIWNDKWLGKVRIRTEGASAKPLFIGIGPEVAVAGYLGRVAHADVEDIDIDPFRVTYRQIAGGAPRRPPTAQNFWAASAAGQGRQTLTWKVRDGDWSVVLMNADASRGVAAEVDLGAKLSFLLWVAIGLLVGGAVLLGGGIALIVLAARTRPPPAAPPMRATTTGEA
jgi:hypothetical protein